MRAAVSVFLALWVVVTSAHADAPSSAMSVFHLCGERVEAVRLVPTGEGAVVHLRLSEPAARELVRASGSDVPVEVRAGEAPFARFTVRDALKDQPSRRLESANGSVAQARALVRAVQRPCPPTEPR